MYAGCIRINSITIQCRAYSSFISCDNFSPNKEGNIIHVQYMNKHNSGMT